MLSELAVILVISTNLTSTAKPASPCRACFSETRAVFQLFLATSPSESDNIFCKTRCQPRIWRPGKIGNYLTLSVECGQRALACSLSKEFFPVVDVRNRNPEIMDPECGPVLQASMQSTRGSCERNDSVTDDNSIGLSRALVALARTWPPRILLALRH